MVGGEHAGRPAARHGTADTWAAVWRRVSPADRSRPTLTGPTPARHHDARPDSITQRKSRPISGRNNAAKYDMHLSDATAGARSEPYDARINYLC